MECMREAYMMARIGSGAPRSSAPSAAPIATKFGTHRQVHFTAVPWLKLSRQLVVQRVPRPEAVGRAASGKLSRGDDSKRKWGSSKSAQGGEVSC